MWIYLQHSELSMLKNACKNARPQRELRNFSPVHSAVNNFFPQLASRAGKMEKLPTRLKHTGPKQKRDLTYGESVDVEYILRVKKKSN